MAGDETTGTPPRGQHSTSAPRERRSEYGQRETELLQGIAAVRDQCISRLAKNLVLQTITEVQEMVGAEPDRYHDPESPIG